MGEEIKTIWKTKVGILSIPAGSELHKTDGGSLIYHGYDCDKDSVQVTIILAEEYVMSHPELFTKELDYASIPAGTIVLVDRKDALSPVRREFVAYLPNGHKGKKFWCKDDGQQEIFGWEKLVDIVETQERKV